MLSERWDAFQCTNWKINQKEIKFNLQVKQFDLCAVTMCLWFSPSQLNPNTRGQPRHFLGETFLMASKYLAIDGFQRRDIPRWNDTIYLGGGGDDEGLPQHHWSSHCRTLAYTLTRHSSLWKQAAFLMRFERRSFHAQMQTPLCTDRLQSSMHENI